MSPIPDATPLFAPAGRDAGPPAQAHVLVVDDDKVTRSVLQHYLEHEGYIVHAVQSGPEALAVLDTFTPDIICLDYMMPGMNGQEVARRIRARHDVIYVPIIMLSGTPHPKTVQWDSLESGVDVFLAKPVVPAELGITVRTMLRMKQAQDLLLVLMGQLDDPPAAPSEVEQRAADPSLEQTTISATLQEIDPALEDIRQAVLDLNRALSLSPHAPLDRAGQATTLMRLNAATTRLSAVVTHLHSA